MNINFSCPINNTGYGLASLNIIKELSKLNKISFFPIGQPGVSNQQDYDLILSLFKNQEEADINAPYIKIWHQFDLGDHFGKGRYYAYPFFELDTFNTREKKHLSIPDELFVSSQWAKNIVMENGISSNIHIVPLGVDLNIFDHKIAKTRKDNKYVFLTIGKWEVRKSHDLLPSIFKQAFPTENDVELWILASENTNSYSTKEQLSQWKSLYSAENIKVFPGLPSHHDVANLIANSDCGLYISKAEGWNLELLETMAMNKPTIATNYSAHTEFCNSDNCYLVDIEILEPAKDGKAFVGQGNWAKIGQNQIDQTIEHMRYVYKNRVDNNLSALKTAQTYSWKNSANIMSGCISS